MKNILILFFVAVAVTGCIYHPSVPIAQPPGPGNTVVTPSESPTVVQPGQTPGAPLPPRVEVWRPDPTLKMVTNTSETIFMKIWISSRPPSPPTLELIPRISVFIRLPMGKHPVYGEGRTKDFYGWNSVGVMKPRDPIEIKNNSFNNIYFGDGDFNH